MAVGNGFEVSVVILKCQTCSRTFPSVIFSADTDMPIVGLHSLTDCSSNRVVVAQGASADLAARRDTNLRELKVLRVEDENQGLARLSFTEFRKRYRPPKRFYQCCYCDRGEALVSESISVDEFRRRGGILETVCGLRLSD